MKLKRFDILLLDSMQTVHAYEMGLPLVTSGTGMWIGTKDKTAASYRFWTQIHNLRFRVPDDIAIGDEVHVGVKNDGKKAKWTVEDFGDRYLVLKRVSELTEVLK